MSGSNQNEVVDSCSTSSSLHSKCKARLFSITSSNSSFSSSHLMTTNSVDSKWDSTQELGLIHLKKLYATYRKLSSSNSTSPVKDGLGVGRDKILYDMLPLFCKVFGKCGPQVISDKFGSLTHFTQICSSLIVGEIRKRASNHSTEEAATSIAEYLLIPYSEDKEDSTDEANRAHVDIKRKSQTNSRTSSYNGWPLLAVLNLLSCEGRSLVQVMTNASLPSTLVKCLYLFFDLPPAPQKQQSWKSDEYSPMYSNQSHVDLLSVSSTEHEDRRHELLQKMFSQLLVRLVCHQMAGHELARKDDLTLLFSAFTSSCPSHNQGWRKICSDVLLTISRHSLSNAIVTHVHGRSCISICVESMQRHVSLIGGGASGKGEIAKNEKSDNTTNKVRVMTDVDSIIEMFVTLYSFLKDSTSLTPQLMDDFKSAQGFQFLFNFIMRIDNLILSDESNETSGKRQELIGSARNLVFLVASFSFCGYDSSSDDIPEIHSIYTLDTFQPHVPENKGSTVRCLDAIYVLQNCFVKSNRICVTILDAFNTIYSADLANYFISSQSTSTLSRFAEIIHSKCVECQTKYFKLIEFVVYHLDFVPFKEFVTICSNVLLKHYHQPSTKQSSNPSSKFAPVPTETLSEGISENEDECELSVSCVRLTLETFLSFIRFNQLFKDAFREVGVLEAVASILKGICVHIARACNNTCCYKASIRFDDNDTALTPSLLTVVVQLINEIVSNKPLNGQVLIVDCNCSESIVQLIFSENEEIRTYGLSMLRSMVSSAWQHNTNPSQSLMSQGIHTGLLSDSNKSTSTPPYFGNEIIHTIFNECLSIKTTNVPKDGKLNAQIRLAIKHSVVSVLITCLKESHRTRAIFRRIGGFENILQALGNTVEEHADLIEFDVMASSSPENSSKIGDEDVSELVPCYSQQKQPIDLIRQYLVCLSVAMRFEPANAHYFESSIDSSSGIGPILSLLTCFTPEALRRDLTDSKEPSPTNNFMSKHSILERRRSIPAWKKDADSDRDRYSHDSSFAFKICVMLAQMAVDQLWPQLNAFDEFDEFDLDSDSGYLSMLPKSLIVHPSLVSSIFHLVVHVDNVIENLLKVEGGGDGDGGLTQNKDGIQSKITKLTSIQTFQLSLVERILSCEQNQRKLSIPLLSDFFRFGGHRVIVQRPSSNSSEFSPSSHPLQKQLGQIFQTLSSHHISTSQLRQYLTSNLNGLDLSTLLWMSMSSDQMTDLVGRDILPSDYALDILFTSVENSTRLMNGDGCVRRWDNTSVRCRCMDPPFVRFDLRFEGFGCLYFPSIAPSHILTSTLGTSSVMPPSAIGSVSDLHRTSSNPGGSSSSSSPSQLMGGVGLGDRLFPFTQGLTLSIWFYVEQFSNYTTDPHPVRLFSIGRCNKSGVSSSQHQQQTAASSHQSNTSIHDLDSLKNNFICFSVSLSARDKSIVISTQEYFITDPNLMNLNASSTEEGGGLGVDSSSTCRVWLPDLISDKRWHHLCVVLNRNTIKSPSVSVYLDSTHVKTDKITYISQQPGYNLKNVDRGENSTSSNSSFTPACSELPFVYGVIGSLPQWRKTSQLSWRVGSTFLTEEVISHSMVSQIYKLSPHYCGNVQGDISSNVYLTESAFGRVTTTTEGNASAGQDTVNSSVDSISTTPGGVIAKMMQQTTSSVNLGGITSPSSSSSKLNEEKILLMLNASTLSILTMADIRKVYSRIDNKAIARQSGMAGNENATPIRLLHNAAGHLTGSARTLGGVVIGYLGVSVEQCQPVSITFQTVGGCHSLLALISLSNTKDSLVKTVKLLTSCLVNNPCLRNEMESMSGYRMLSLLFRQKVEILSCDILKCMFVLATGLSVDQLQSLEDGLDMTDGDIIWIDSVFRDIICDLHLWHSCSEYVYFKSEDNIMSPSSPRVREEDLLHIERLLYTYINCLLSSTSGHPRHLYLNELFFECNFLKNMLSILKTRSCRPDTELIMLNVVHSILFDVTVLESSSFVKNSLYVFCTFLSTLISEHTIQMTSPPIASDKRMKFLSLDHQNSVVSNNSSPSTIPCTKPKPNSNNNNQYVFGNCGYDNMITSSINSQQQNSSPSATFNVDERQVTCVDVCEGVSLAPGTAGTQGFRGKAFHGVTSSGGGSQTSSADNEHDWESTIWVIMTRNRCLKLLCTFLLTEDQGRKSNHSLTSGQCVKRSNVDACQTLVDVVGCDWLLTFIRRFIHSTSVIWALRILSILLSVENIRDKFRMASHNGQWVLYRDSLLSGSNNVAFNVFEHATGSSGDTKQSENNGDVENVKQRSSSHALKNTQVQTGAFQVPGFQQLNWLLPDHICTHEIYFILVAMALGQPALSWPPPEPGVSVPTGTRSWKDSTFGLDSVWMYVFGETASQWSLRRSSSSRLDVASSSSSSETESKRNNSKATFKRKVAKNREVKVVVSGDVIITILCMIRRILSFKDEKRCVGQASSSCAADVSSYKWLHDLPVILVQLLYFLYHNLSSDFMPVFITEPVFQAFVGAIFPTNSKDSTPPRPLKPFYSSSSTDFGSDQSSSSFNSSEKVVISTKSALKGLMEQVSSESSPDIDTLCTDSTTILEETPRGGDGKPSKIKHPYMPPSFSRDPVKRCIMHFMRTIVIDSLALPPPPPSPTFVSQNAVTSSSSSSLTVKDGANGVSSSHTAISSFSSSSAPVIDLLIDVRPENTSHAQQCSFQTELLSMIMEFLLSSEALMEEGVSSAGLVSMPPQLSFIASSSLSSSSYPCSSSDEMTSLETANYASKSSDDQQSSADLSENSRSMKTSHYWRKDASHKIKTASSEHIPSNVFYLTSRLVDKLWSGILMSSSSCVGRGGSASSSTVMNKDEAGECVGVQVAAFIIKLIGQAKKRKVIPTLDSIYRSLNRTILYLFSNPNSTFSPDSIYVRPSSSTLQPVNQLPPHDASAPLDRERRKLSKKESEGHRCAAESTSMRFVGLDASQILQILNLIIENRCLIFGAGNHDLIFFASLTHCLIQVYMNKPILFQEEELTTSKNGDKMNTGDSARSSVSGSKKNVSDVQATFKSHFINPAQPTLEIPEVDDLRPNEDFEIVRRAANRVWQELFISKQPALQQVFKGQNMKLSGNDTPDLETVVAGLSDAAASQWRTYSQLERDGLYSKCEYTSGAWGDLIGSQIESRIQKTLGGISGKLKHFTSSVSSSKIGYSSSSMSQDSNSSGGGGNSSSPASQSLKTLISTPIYSLVPMTIIDRYTVQHLTLICDCVNLCFSQLKTTNSQKVKVISHQWKSILQGDVFGERGILGPVLECDGLTKWMLDMSEGPSRMRKKLIRNYDFFRAYGGDLKGSLRDIYGGHSIDNVGDKLSSENTGVASTDEKIEQIQSVPISERYNPAKSQTRTPVSFDSLAQSEAKRSLMMCKNHRHRSENRIRSASGIGGRVNRGNESDWRQTVKTLVSSVTNSHDVDQRDLLNTNVETNGSNSLQNSDQMDLFAIDKISDVDITGGDEERMASLKGIIANVNKSQVNKRSKMKKLEKSRRFKKEQQRVTENVTGSTSGEARTGTEERDTEVIVEANDSDDSSVSSYSSATCYDDKSEGEDGSFSSTEYDEEEDEESDEIHSNDGEIDHQRPCEDQGKKKKSIDSTSSYQVMSRNDKQHDSNISTLHSNNGVDDIHQSRSGVGDTLAYILGENKQEKITDMYKCARIEGLDSIEGVLVLCSADHFYVIDGFTIVNSHSHYDESSASSGDRKNLTSIESAKQLNKYEPVIPYGVPPPNTSGRSDSVSSTNSSTSKIKGWCHKFAYDMVKEVHKRRYLLQPIAIEIFSFDGDNQLLAFNKSQRSKVYHRLILTTNHLLSSNSAISGSSGHGPDSVTGQRTTTSVESSGGAYFFSALMGETSVTQRWVKGEISNFDYLMALNTLAGRSYNDLMQYPVFPWIIADYESEELDFCRKETFRDLSRPMGAQSEDRLKQFTRRYEEWDCSGDDGSNPAYHYGTHYSSAMIVSSYLVRLEPFSQHFLSLQGGHFDLADRMFHSIKDTWLSASTKNMADVRELIPEFFYLPDFLMNNNKFDLGVKQCGLSLNDVQLPPWAKGCPREFIRNNAEALESDYVSANLHKWIDLVFGCKQQGVAAVNSCNVFHHLFYENNVDIFSIEDPVQRNATIGFINNFGQIPKQIFKKAHPAKYMKAPGMKLILPPVNPPSPSSENNPNAFQINDKIFYHQLTNLRPSLTPIRQLKLGAVGQIYVTNNLLHAVEHNKVVVPSSNRPFIDPFFKTSASSAISPKSTGSHSAHIPQLSSGGSGIGLASRYISWGHSDNTFRLCDSETDEPVLVCESTHLTGQILTCICPSPKIVIIGGTCSIIYIFHYYNCSLAHSGISALSAAASTGGVGAAKLIKQTTSLATSKLKGSSKQFQPPDNIDQSGSKRLNFSFKLMGGEQSFLNRTGSTTSFLTNRKRFTLFKTLSGHSDAVTCLKSCNVWSIMVSGSRDRTAIIWNLSTYEYVKTIAWHVGPVTDISINDATGDIVTCSGCFFYLWTINGKFIASVNCDTISPSAAPQFAPDPKCPDLFLNPIFCIVTSHLNGWDRENVIVTGSADGAVRLWSFEYTEVSPHTKEVITEYQRRTVSENNSDEQFVRSQYALKSHMMAWNRSDSVVTREGTSYPEEKKDYCWIGELVFRGKLSMHTAFERSDNVEPASVTALAISLDHKSLYVGDQIGRLFSWSVGAKPGKGMVDHWCLDEAQSVCTACSVQFTVVYERRHHCRKCGKLFCNSCTKFRSSIPSQNIVELVRVCKACHDTLQQQQS